MTDVAVKIDGIVTKLLVPAKLPDLFQGGRVVLLGRYEGSGHCAIRLSGRVEGVLREYVYEGDLAGDERSLGHDFVPKLWAERRVATLLDAIRLNGPAAELVDEVRLLGREYGVVTPYTSHLIVEDGLALGPRPGGAGGRGGGGAYRGPGDSRPPVATNGGPGTPGPAGPSTPGPSGPATGGRAAASEGEPPSLDDLAARLRDAGVLPKDAAPAELRRLAAEVARELRSAESGLRDLGRRASGEAAVDDSAFLARLLDPTAGSPSDEFFMGGGKARERARLLDRFVRTVRDKVFVLREGVWVDRSYDDAKMRERKRVVEAWSKEYFELIEEHPELRPWLALSARLIVVLEGQAIEIREPAPPDTARDPSRSGTGG
jgi:Ca-activated chloride channel family protein